MNFILNQIDNENQYLTKSSSTTSLLLSSDIPTLLHSIGITNCTDEEFSVPLDFESVIHLCTLLIERCRVLQYILLKNNDISLNSSIDHDFNNDCVLYSHDQNHEQCKIFIHKHDHIALDTLFQRIYNGMNQTINSDDWQIIIEKPIDQVKYLNSSLYREISQIVLSNKVYHRRQNLLCISITFCLHPLSHLGIDTICSS